MNITTTALKQVTVGNHDVRLVRYDGIARDRYKVVTYQRMPQGSTFNARTIAQCDSEQLAWFQFADLVELLEAHTS
jgi:hypothetical protein